MPPKKRKISDFSAADSELMLDALRLFVDKLDPNDAESLEVIQLAQSLNVKISQTRHTPLSSVTGQNLLDLHIYARWLQFKPDGKERARQRGAAEVEGNYLTLEMTKRLVETVFRHVSRSTEAGCRILIDIILLRLAAVLSNNVERIYIIPEYPLRSVSLDHNHSFGGIVDYILAKYPAKSNVRLLLTPQSSLEDNVFRRRGSVNIFEAKSLYQLELGIPQCVLATASWCRTSDDQKMMRGVVTTGQEWIFFAYKRGEQRSHYARTPTFKISEDLSDLDWILGLIIDWIENAKSDHPFEYLEDTEEDAEEDTEE